MSNIDLCARGLVAYTPQNPTEESGELSKNPGLSLSGRMANPSTCHEFILVLTRKPSKLKRTFGPSRTSTNLPEPYSNSCRPTRNWTEFGPSLVLISKKAAWKSSFFSSIGLGPPARKEFNPLLNSINVLTC